MVATVHVDLSDHAGGTITLAPVHGCTHTLTLTGDATVTLAAAPGTAASTTPTTTSRSHREPPR